jgi:hypothetical protein
MRNIFKEEVAAASVAGGVLSTTAREDQDALIPPQQPRKQAC